MDIRKLASHKFIQGGFLFTFIGLFVGFLSYIFNSLSAKLLGPQVYSELATFTSYSVVLSIPIITLTTDIIRRIGAMEQDQTVAIARWERLLYARSFRYIWMLPLLFAIAYVFGRATNLGYTTSLTLLFISLLSIYWGFYVASFQAMHWFGLYSALMISVIGFKLFGPLIPIPGISRLDGILIFILLSNLITIFLGRKLFNVRHKKISATKDQEIVGRLRRIVTNKTLVVTMLSLVAMNLFNNLDVMIARKILSPYESGLYASWSLFAKIIFYITGPLTAFSLIFFSSHKYKDHHSKALVGLVVVLFVVGTVMSILYQIVGPFLINLVFSKEYLAVNQYLPLAGIFGVMYSGIFFFNSYYLSRASNYCLIGLAALPIYAAALLLFGKTSAGIIQVNIMFSSALFIFYIASILHYNRVRWNKKAKVTS